MKLIDARNMACPKPVIETKKFLEENRECIELAVLVDNPAASENVSRFLSNCGFEVSVARDGDTLKITGLNKKGEEASHTREEADEFSETKTLVMIARDKMGSGDSALGEKLMKNFIATLYEYQGLWMLVFVNSGVKLAVSGSGALEDLKKLAESGVKILVCGTCLDHYKILEAKEVGETTNMLDIVTSLNLADKVIAI
jgi:selenium metabolism protein YedF